MFNAKDKRFELMTRNKNEYLNQEIRMFSTAADLDKCR